LPHAPEGGEQETNFIDAGVHMVGHRLPFMRYTADDDRHVGATIGSQPLSRSTDLVDRQWCVR
jgi:hypothetical protein